MIAIDARVRWRLLRSAILLCDLISLGAGLVLATAARYEGIAREGERRRPAHRAGLAVALYLILGTALRLHHGRYAVGSSRRAQGPRPSPWGLCDWACSRSTSPPASPRLLPLSVPPVAASLSFVLMIGFRLVIRSQREGAVRPRAGQRTLVFGAGNAGEQLIRSMLGDTRRASTCPSACWTTTRPSGTLRIRGVRMLGGRERIAAAAARRRARRSWSSPLPSADSALVRDISQRATAGRARRSRCCPRVSDLLSRPRRHPRRARHQHRRPARPPADRHERRARSPTT